MRLILLLTLLSLSWGEFEIPANQTGETYFIEQSSSQDHSVACIQGNGTKVFELVFDEINAQNDLNWVLTRIKNDKRFITTLVICPDASWFVVYTGSSYSLYVTPQQISAYDHSYAVFIDSFFPAQVINHDEGKPWTGFEIFLIVLLCLLVITVFVLLCCCCGKSNQSGNDIAGDIAGAVVVGVVEGAVEGAIRNHRHHNY